MSVFRFVRFCFEYTGLVIADKIEESIMYVYFISTFFFSFAPTHQFLKWCSAYIIQLESGGGCFWFRGFWSVLKQTCVMPSEILVLQSSFKEG